MLVSKLLIKELVVNVYFSGLSATRVFINGHITMVQSVDRRMDRTRGGGRAPVLPLEKPAAGRMLQESPQLGVLSQPGALEGLPPHPLLLARDPWARLSLPGQGSRPRSGV